MRLVFNPLSQILDKGRKLPPGTRRLYGDVWFKKQGDGKWTYDGMQDSKSAPHPGVSSQSSQSVPTSRFEQVHKLSQSDISELIEDTTKRDRMSFGQKVRYVGRGNPAYSGKAGKLIGVGEGGSAVIQMPDGKAIDAKWASVRPEGAIKPFSVYDGLSEGQVFRYSGEVQKSIDAIMNTKIGSGGTYKDLCEGFRKEGFNLYMVGGAVRDVMSGKPANDIDFVVDATDRELYSVLKKINPAWVGKITKTNPAIGLISFKDGSEEVDITPIHRYSPETKRMMKGWNLKEDGTSRDFAMNSLHVEPLDGIMVDATGQGVKDIEENTLSFSNADILGDCPRNVIRTFKFLARGYKLTPDAETALKKNLPSTLAMRHGRRISFIDTQVGQKDGLEGLKKFRNYFKKYDVGGVWDSGYKAAFETVYAKYGGKV